MSDIGTIIPADRQHPAHERSLPWPETGGGLTVVIGPKPHWPNDMRAFRSDVRDYGTCTDWTKNGARARFSVRKARTRVTCETADGLWN